VQVYASTVQQQVRTQVLTSILRMVYYNSPEMLRCAMSSPTPSVFACLPPACIKCRHHLHLPWHKAHIAKLLSSAATVEGIKVRTTALNNKVVC
jgi:hypothetical protein